MRNSERERGGRERKKELQEKREKKEKGREKIV